MNMDFEQLLKQEVQKAARQDYEEITAKAQDYPYKFSKEFNEKMKGIIREEKKKAKKKRRVHILLVAAILLILNAGIVLANDDLREKVGTFIIHFFEDNIYIHDSGETEDSEKTFQQLQLTYIPEGYHLLYETENPVTMYNAYYEGSNDSYISFTQGFKENVDVHVTYDGTGKKKIQVNGKDVYIVKDKNITSCYYEDKGCIISLSSTEKESEFIKILKNIK